MSEASDPSALNAAVPAQEDVSIRALAISKVFEQLSLRQRLYAHYLSQYASI
jgi:hypothetical protein